MNREHLELCASDEWRQTLRDLVLPYALAGAGLGDDVLEVGPGPGMTTDLLRAEVDRLTALELDDDLARALASRLAGTNAEVIQGDATAMPFEDGRFSGAVSLTMLHHVPTADLQDRLFAEVARVLRPGGLFVASDSVASDELAAFHHDDTYNPVDPGSVGDRLAAAGFAEVEVRANAFGWAAHARRPAGQPPPGA
jgi:SAM-dependent methyltransferase